MKPLSLFPVKESVRLRRRGVFLFLALAFFLCCACTGNGVPAPPPENRKAAVAVSVFPVAPAPLRDVFVLPGETEAYYDVRLAADLNGLVEWIGPKEGDEVKLGELIAQIDVAALKAALESAEASFNLADRQYERRKGLFDRGVAAKEELDRTMTERTQALSALRQARVEYQRGFVRSPVHGIVNRLFVDEGEYVDRGNPVADVVNVVKIKVVVNVPERDVSFLAVGREVFVTVDALPGRSLVGTIDFVPFKADGSTRTFPVRVVLFNQGRDIRPGMIARVAFLRRLIPDALSVPLSAVVDKGGERLLFVEESGVARSRSIEIGVIQRDRVQIVKGLSPGDRVIVTGQNNVEDGIPVEVR